MKATIELMVKPDCLNLGPLEVLQAWAEQIPSGHVGEIPVTAHVIWDGVGDSWPKLQITLHKPECLESVATKGEAMSEDSTVHKFRQHQAALTELVRAVDAFREEYPNEWVRLKTRCEKRAEDIGQAMWDAKVCLRENQL